MTKAASLPEKTYAAFLFDMDGTILNSTASAERVWGRWAEKHGLDVEKFLPTMHGKRGIDTITGLNLPGVDAEAEAAIILQGEIDDVDGVVPLPGAIEFLASLPPEKWAIVTSSPMPLAERRLAAAGITKPGFMVTAEDVKIGKPNPQCYILGAERVGVSPAETLVWEDVLAGVQAGEAAGADVAVISHTHKHPLQTSHMTFGDYSNIAVHVDADGRLSLRSR